MSDFFFHQWYKDRVNAKVFNTNQTNNLIYIVSSAIKYASRLQQMLKKWRAEAAWRAPPSMRDRSGRARHYKASWTPAWQDGPLARWQLRGLDRSISEKPSSFQLIQALGTPPSPINRTARRRMLAPDLESEMCRASERISSGKQHTTKHVSKIMFYLVFKCTFLLLTILITSWHL